MVRCAVGRPILLVPLMLCLFAAPVYGQKKAAAERAAVDLAQYDARIKAGDRQHWAFQPVREAALPQARERRWVRNPIDAFVLSRLETEGWKPNPAALPRALLRRVHLDLAGLPPSLAEQDGFVADPTPSALDRVIDELLARPSYGERWGRHWLDLVRYAETNGYERDAARPFVWRYRDYVIRSFNDDKPFDRFVLEQLAGDELPDADGTTLIATGYYRLGPWDDEPADPQEDRFDQLDDLVSTTSLAFLGLTLGCARCHDHKFDALTMHDYYRLVAVFNGLNRPQAGRTELVLPAGLRQKVELQRRRDKLMAVEMAPAVIHLKETATGRTVAKLEDPHGDRATWQGFTPGADGGARRSRRARGKTARLSFSRKAQQLATSGPGPLDRRSQQPAHRARARQSRVAAPFRRRAGCHAERLRRHGPAADPSRIARLAGCLVRRQRLVVEKTAQVHRDVRRLPAGQPPERPCDAKRPDQPVAFALQHPAS